MTNLAMVPYKEVCIKQYVRVYSNIYEDPTIQNSYSSGMHYKQCHYCYVIERDIASELSWEILLTLPSLCPTRSGAIHSSGKTNRELQRDSWFPPLPLATVSATSALSLARSAEVTSLSASSEQKMAAEKAEAHCSASDCKLCSLSNFSSLMSIELQLPSEVMLSIPMGLCSWILLLLSCDPSSTTKAEDKWVSYMEMLGQDLWSPERVRLA